MHLEKIVENHTRAVGGRAVIEGVNALQVKFHITEPSFAVDGLYAAERNGRMRVDIYADKTRVFSEGYDGATGWQLPQDATLCLPTSPAGTATLLQGIEKQLYGLHELECRGHRLAFVGRDTIENVDYAVIDINFSDSHRQKIYINTNSWLVERSREHKALHPDMDPTEVTLETRYSDFRTVDGLLCAFQDVQVDQATGEVVQTTVVNELTLNPTLAPHYFDCPYPMQDAPAT